MTALAWLVPAALLLGGLGLAPSCGRSAPASSRISKAPPIARSRTILRKMTTSTKMRGLKDTDYVLAKLAFMREERIWPNGLRYLWTDAFGVVLLVSLYEELKEQRFLDEADELVADVMRVLGGSAASASAKSLIATDNISTTSRCGSLRLSVLGRHEPYYRERGIALRATFTVPSSCLAAA